MSNIKSHKIQKNMTAREKTTTSKTIIMRSQTVWAEKKTARRGVYNTYLQIQWTFKYKFTCFTMNNMNCCAVNACQTCMAIGKLAAKPGNGEKVKEYEDN